MSSTTAIIRLTSRKLEWDEKTIPLSMSHRFVVASYNIRYARGPYLISGGLRRKVGLMSLARGAEHVGQQISEGRASFLGRHTLAAR